MSLSRSSRIKTRTRIRRKQNACVELRGVALNNFEEKDLCVLEVLGRGEFCAVAMRIEMSASS